MNGVMELSSVYEWFNKRGMTATANMLKNINRNDNMIKTSTIKSICDAQSIYLFKELQCDVVTYTQLERA